MAKKKNEELFKLINPFTPMKAATSPDDFYGRGDEIESLDRGLDLAHVAIQGGVGIGKTSLLQRVRLLEEGFDGDESCSESYIVLGNKDIHSLNDAAKLVLQEFVLVDSVQTTNKSGISKILSFEKSITEITTNYSDGRCLGVLNKIISEWSIKNQDSNLILAFDEADKCPLYFAQLFRNLIGYCDSHQISNIRLMVAGVNPYFKKMTDEDPGVRRFFTEVITLKPMLDEDAEELLIEKFKVIREKAQADGFSLEVDLEVIEKIIHLSGGHPHLIQLLGFRIIENENSDPDGTIDDRDLVGSLRAICFDDRAVVYQSIIHLLEIESKLEPLKQLFEIADVKCPTKIGREAALEIVGGDTMQWYVDNNILLPEAGDTYRLEDEFLRIRLMFEEDTLTPDVEQQFIEDESYFYPDSESSFYDE